VCSFPSAKTRARKSQFRKTIQADLGCPDLRRKIFIFLFFRNWRTLALSRPEIEGRIAIVTDVGLGCGGRALSRDERHARGRRSRGPGAPMQALSSRAR
jgi:hypothetical protein